MDMETLKKTCLTMTQEQKKESDWSNYEMKPDVSIYPNETEENEEKQPKYCAISAHEYQMNKLEGSLLEIF